MQIRAIRNENLCDTKMHVQICAIRNAFENLYNTKCYFSFDTVCS